MNSSELVLQSALKLKKSFNPVRVIAGFDGFIDEILHVVKQRISPTEYIRLDYMQEFADKISAAAGLSGNMEYASQQIKLGGNGPILANALIACGYKMDYIGTLGKYNLHPVYQEFATKCERVTSFLDPGFTDAIEFKDGKMMMGRMKNLEKMSFENLLKEYPEAELKQSLANSKLLVMTDWNALPEMNGLFEGFGQLLHKIKHRIKIFIDLADPAKHSFDEIKTAMYKLSELNNHADVMLGLNENESRLIAKSLNIIENKICQRAEKIRTNLDLYGVVIHPIAGAAVATKDGNHWLDGPVTKHPKLTTGAGDNFNAGFCNGWLSNLTPNQCLATGVCTSGYYVRNCHSPNIKELSEFMQAWSEVDCGEI